MEFINVKKESYCGYQETTDWFDFDEVSYYFESRPSSLNDKGLAISKKGNCFFKRDYGTGRFYVRTSRFEAFKFMIENDL